MSESVSDAKSADEVASPSPPPPPPPPPPRSVYELRSPAAKRWILAGAAWISLLTPATDTIYLPALTSVRAALGGSADAVTATVSVYMACVGLCSLVWGPLSDRVGRRAPLVACLALFLAFTAACAFAPTIDALVGLRACEGVFVGATISVTQAVVADTFAPHERGTALGLFFLPLLVGPILAPIVGGALAAAFGWASTFWLLLVLGGALFFVALALPETHLHLAQQLRRRGGEGAAPPAGEVAAPPAGEVAAPPAGEGVAPPDRGVPSAAEAVAEADVPRGAMVAPWVPLGMMLDSRILPHVLLSGSNFAAMFTSLTLLPTLLAVPPYSLSETAVGLCFIPIGVAMMVGSVLGGAASDRYAALSPGVTSARLLPSCLGSLFALPAGCLVFGFTIGAGGSVVAALLLGHTLIGLGQAYYMGGFMAFLTETMQARASAAAAGSMAVNFALAASLISAAVPLQAALGTAGIFALFAGVHVLVAAGSLRDIRTRAAAAVVAGALAPEAAAASAALAPDAAAASAAGSELVAVAAAL